MQLAERTTGPLAEPAAGPLAEPAARRRTSPTTPSLHPSWRIVLGLLIGVFTLVIPWLGPTLNPSLSAWHLTLAVGGVPLVGHLSYGLLLAPTLLVSTASAWRSRGKATNTTRTCGWIFLGAAVLFVVTTRVMGTEVLFRLSSATVQTRVIDRQILEYHFAPPTSYLGVTPDATTSLILSALRVGWCLSMVAGGLLAGRWVTPLRHRRAAVVALLAVGVVVAWAFTTGVLAGAAKSDGVSALLTGHSASAERDFDRALALNPQLRYDGSLETDLGQAQEDQGQQTALAWFAETASPPTTGSGIATQVLEYSQALSLAPNNPVIRNGFAVSLANDMIGAQAPVDPTAVAMLNGMAFLSFTYGHYAYEAGDDSATIGSMDRALATTHNGELRSLAYTYRALSEQRLGEPRAFRRDIVEAVDLDTQNVNGLAREVAAGLYTPGPP
jgi:hypothetical protein